MDKIKFGEIFKVLAEKKILGWVTAKIHKGFWKKRGFFPIQQKCSYVSAGIQLKNFT